MQCVPSCVSFKLFFELRSVKIWQLGPSSLELINLTNAIDLKARS